jgi:hypothetical protein
MSSELPMLSACSLGQAALSAQLERYRVVGLASVVVERDTRRVAVRVGDTVADALVEELVAVERRCCPFFSVDWEPGARVLALGVTSGEGSDATALAALAEALGAG